MMEEHMTPNEIKAYLDHAITNWRGIRDESKSGTRVYIEAVCYIDAYQSVRVTLFNEMLPVVN